MLSNGEIGAKEVELGADHPNAGFRDFLGNRDYEIRTDDHGKATFPTHGGSVSVLLRSEV